jgi:hypothetical protein
MGKSKAGKLLGIGLGLVLTLQAQALTLKEIGQWVDRGEVKSVAEVLARLPRDLRSRFVLMERSRSLQEASPDSPRALLYGDRGELVLAFNGRADQRGYGTLEAIELDPARMTYEIRTFDFRGEKPRVSGANPELCLRCHRSVPRPSWEPYPYWPGALGQSPKYSVDERRRLQAFAAAAPRHPLYRYLDFSQGAARASTPAFELYALFTEQNLRRLPRLLAASPEYVRYRPALLGALADCPDLKDWTTHPNKEAVWQSYRQDTLRRYQALPAPYQAELTLAIPSVVAKLRYLLETRGFPADALANSFTERFFLTAAGAFVPQLLSRMDGLPTSVPMGALSAYFQPGTRPYGDVEKAAHAQFCDSLRREIR